MFGTVLQTYFLEWQCAALSDRIPEHLNSAQHLSETKFLDENVHWNLLSWSKNVH